MLADDWVVCYFFEFSQNGNQILTFSQTSASPNPIRLVSYARKFIEARLRDSGVEEKISSLDPEVSKIYFDAKDEVINAQDSRTERFSAASRILRTFWKLFHKQ